MLLTRNDLARMRGYIQKMEDKRSENTLNCNDLSPEEREDFVEMLEKHMVSEELIGLGFKEGRDA